MHWHLRKDLQAKVVALRDPDLTKAVGDAINSSWDAKDANGPPHSAAVVANSQKLSNILDDVRRAGDRYRLEDTFAPAASARKP